MSAKSKRLERLLDALTEDIFNDIECAKAVINEAGFDSNISSTQGAKKIAQLQEETLKESTNSIVCDVGISTTIEYRTSSIECTIFRIDNGRLTIRDTGDLSLRLSHISYKNIGNNSFSSSKNIDEEKLQLN